MRQNASPSDTLYALAARHIILNVEEGALGSTWIESGRVSIDGVNPSLLQLLEVIIVARMLSSSSSASTDLAIG